MKDYAYFLHSLRLQVLPSYMRKQCRLPVL